jgi:hypothetical protein
VVVVMMMIDIHVSTPYSGLDNRGTMTLLQMNTRGRSEEIKEGLLRAYINKLWQAW